MNTIFATHSILNKIAFVFLTSLFIAACGGGGTPENIAPTANAGDNKTIQVNHSITITGSGTDSDGSINSYKWKSGTDVLATTASFSYTPTAVGTDTLTLTVVDNDDASASDNMDVVVSSTPVPNQAPVAKDVSANTNEDASKDITLLGTDNEDDTLNYIKLSDPANGTISFDSNIATYTPNSNYNGSDSFTYKVNDGAQDSNTATVTISVEKVNDAPAAADINANTKENTAKAVTLLGTDIDGDTLSYTTVSNPSHGSVSINGNVASYTPTNGYKGEDSFAYKTNDGILDSNTATVTVIISVETANQAPAAQDVSADTNEDTNKGITLQGTDSNGDSLSYIKVTDPAHGSVSFNDSLATYTPTDDFNGADSFTYKVNDNTLDSNTATVSITINAVNDKPVGIDQDIVITAGEVKSITLSGTDVDGDNLTYSVVSAPTQGTFEGSTYTPNADFSGTDSFTFKANDGTIDSDIATINITSSNNTSSPTVRNSIPATPALDGIYPPMSANGGLRWEYMKNQYNNWYHRQAPSENNNVRGATNGEAWRYDPMKTLTELCRRSTLTGDNIPGACTDAENTTNEFLSLQYWGTSGDYPDCSGGITGITRGANMVNPCDFKYGGHASALHYATEIHNQTPYTDNQKEMLKEYCTVMGWNTNLWEHFTERNWGISLQCLVDLQKQGVDTSTERTSLINELYSRTNTAGVGAPVHGLNGHEGTALDPDPQIFSPWMGSSFLIPALWEHWIFLEKDPRIAELIVMYGDAMMNYGIVNPDEWAPDVEWNWKHGQNNTPWLTLYLAVPDDKTFNIQLQNSEGGYSDSHNPEAIFAINAAYFFSCHEPFKDRSDAMMPYFNNAIANDDPDPLSRIFLWQHRGSASTEWLLENANCPQ